MKESIETTQERASDAISLSIFQHLFAAIAEEMGVRLQRSAYSPNIKERLDFSCALFDAAGEMIAQAAHIPVHLGATPMSLRAILDIFPASSMAPDDRFVVNDPYAGGTHLPDITVVAPCFCEGEETPRFFVVNRAHHADVGGLTPGSMPLSSHIDQEGVRISPQRLDQPCIDWICQESRTPDERRGDLQAQMAALMTGIVRLQALCVRYGATFVSAQAHALQAYTAAMMERVIESIPDGVYHFEDTLDDDGFGHLTLKLRCDVTIQGSHAIVDLTGCDDQVEGPVNAVRAIALSAVNYVFCCLAPSEIPANAGVMRSIDVRTRAGSLVDALPPAAVAGGNVETSQRLVDVVMGALAQALPDVIPAASCGSMNNITIGGLDHRTGQPFAYYETLAGGAGAGPQSHGADAIHTHMTNTRNTPVESLEHAYPFRIQTYHLREGTGGIGATSGGMGLCRAYAFVGPAEVTLLTERRIQPPYGLQGGGAGQVGRNILRASDGSIKQLPGKCSFWVQAGDILEIHTPGGGGWGAHETTQS